MRALGPLLPGGSVSAGSARSRHGRRPPSNPSSYLYASIRHSSSSNSALATEEGPTSSGQSSSRERQMLERLWSASELLWTPTASNVAQGRAGFTALPVSSSVFLVEAPPRPPNPTERNKNVHEKSPDYFANVGDAIRTLREDIPLLFQKDLNYEIYRDDIVFRDPRNCFQGMKNYQTIFWSLQFHGKLFFKTLYVEVKRIWQPNDSEIKMRWTVHGVPRVPWEAEGLFDGISTYKLDNTGKIYEHSVDNVLLRDPPMATNQPLLARLNLVPTGQQTPVPGAWFQPTPLASRSSSPAAAAGSACSSSGAAAAETAAPAPAGASATSPQHSQQLIQQHQQQQQGTLQVLVLQLRWSTVRLLATSLAAAASAELLQVTSQEPPSQPSVATGPSMD